MEAIMAKKIEHEELKIEVRGPEHASNSFICRLIADALREIGVNKMEVISQFGDDLEEEPLAEVFLAAKANNPLFDLAGVTIFPDGPVMEEVTVHESADRMEDDEPTDAELEMEYFDE
jgi:hypothetical protein